MRIMIITKKGKLGLKNENQSNETTNVHFTKLDTFPPNVKINYIAIGTEHTLFLNMVKHQAMSLDFVKRANVFGDVFIKTL